MIGAGMTTTGEDGMTAAAEGGRGQEIDGGIKITIETKQASIAQMDARETMEEEDIAKEGEEHVAEMGIAPDQPIESVGIMIQDRGVMKRRR